MTLAFIEGLTSPLHLLICFGFIIPFALGGLVGYLVGHKRGRETEITLRRQRLELEQREAEFRRQQQGPGAGT